MYANMIHVTIDEAFALPEPASLSPCNCILTSQHLKVRGQKQGYLQREYLVGRCTMYSVGNLKPHSARGIRYMGHVHIMMSDGSHG